MTKQRTVSIYLNAFGFVTSLWAVFILFVSIYGPRIEPYVAGYVIKLPKADQVFRGYVTKRESGREVEVACFRLHDIRKLSAAIPMKYAFDVEAKLSDKIPVSAYLADDHHFQAESDLITHPVGQVWSRSYCFEMPCTIADNQAIRVSGHAEHRRLIWGRPFPFWLSITPAPEFLVLPTQCYREDGTVDQATQACRA